MLARETVLFDVVVRERAQSLPKPRPSPETPAVSRSTPTVP